MANWKHKVDLSQEWQEYDAAELTVQQLCGRVAEKLKQLAPHRYDEELKDIVADFVNLAEADGAHIDEFDEILDRLYDWGDTTLSVGKWPQDRMCWIATF